MKVRIPPTLRAATGGEREVPARGDTVRERRPAKKSEVPHTREEARARTLSTAEA